MLKASDLLSMDDPPRGFEWSYIEMDDVYRGSAQGLVVDDKDTIFASVGKASCLLKLDAKTGKVEAKSGELDWLTQNNDIVLAEDGGVVLVGLNYELNLQN
tara:strand:- start:244 stop:546 length:303 start_codon:yes stop_codon:yes gene_type:complete